METHDGEEGWITLENGEHVLIDKDTGEVKSGAGGNLSGKHYGSSESSESRNQSNSARNPSLREGHEEFHQPLKVERETEKAIGISNPDYEAAKEIYGSGSQYEKHRFLMETTEAQRQAYENRQSLIWLPKSQVSIENGNVIGSAGWLAEKNGFGTKEASAKSEERFNAGKQRYEALVQKAKAAGVPGIRNRMKTSTIKDLMKKHGVSADSSDEYEDEALDWAIGMDSNRVEDQNGYVMIENNPISRAGVFPYLGKTIGAPEPDRIYNVYRPAEELSSQACLDSFKLIPIINDHTMLGPEDSGYTPADKKGVMGVVGEDVAFKENTLYGNLKIFGETLKRLIESGKKELSLGYRCVYDAVEGTFDGQGYQYIQRQLRGNHLALVDQARCAVAVLDHKITMDSFDLNLKGMEMTEESNMAQPAPTEKVEVEAKDNDMTGLADRLSALDAKIDKLLAGEAEETTEAADQEMVGKAVEDAKKAMDAADSLKAELEAMKKNGTKAMLAEINKRNELASRLSHHIGTFDHSEMTLDEVAAYGASKLGIKCGKGSEMVALDGFLHNRTAPTRQSAYALDSAASGKGSFVDSYITKSKE